jgi:RNA polymerase sigma factor (sigma-70 family)
MGDVRGYNSQAMPAASVTTPAPLGAFRSKRLLSLASDERLVEQIRRGNELAFEVAFERHGGGILGFCRHMLGSVEEAEDAVQHTFAAAFKDLQRDGERRIALKAWLYTIARNRCVSTLRARREQAEELRDLPTEGLSEQVQRRAELRELLADVRELPEDQRAALLLVEAAGLSHAEVGEVLGCEASAVKGIVFRARSGLIERRNARGTPCDEIREQLETLRGGALRRNELRHHLRHCPGCQAYRARVRDQRKMLAAALPVMPSVALKSSVLAAVGIGGGSAGAGGGLAGGGSAGGAVGGSAGSGAVGGGVAGGAVGGGAVGGAIGGASAGGFAFGSAAVAKLALVGVLAGGGIVAGEAVIDQSRPAATEQVAPAAGDGGAAPSTAGAQGDGRTGNAHDLGETRGARGERISSERSHGKRGAERRSEHAQGRGKHADKGGKHAAKGQDKAAKGGSGNGNGRGVAKGGTGNGNGPGNGNGGRGAAGGSPRSLPEQSRAPQARVKRSGSQAEPTPLEVVPPSVNASPRAQAAPRAKPKAPVAAPPGQAKK